LVLTVSETGYGRLSKPEDYRVQSRGGKGLINYHTEKYGDVAAIHVVNLDDDIIMISQDGIIIRIAAESIRICARPSKGVTLMKVSGEDKVVTIARAPHETDEENSEVADMEENSIESDDSTENTVEE
jgi:DNA gyrase subunit A